MSNLSKNTLNAKSYNDLRNELFKLNPQEIGINLESNNQVYASVVDMVIEGETATLVCVIDGTVSLYYSDNSNDKNLGENNDIYQAAGSYLCSSNQVIKHLKKAKSYDLVTDNYKKVYLLTKDGIYTARYKDENYNNYPKHIKFLMVLIQNVIETIFHSRELTKK